MQLQFHTKLIDLPFNINQLDNSKWVPSDFGMHGKERFLDTAIRKSNQYFLQIPGVDNSYCNGGSIQWKALKYDQGYFIRHRDQKRGPEHIGVQILLPPKQQCSYQEGQLVVFVGEQQIEVTPDVSKWKRVYIPLQTDHEVRPVRGIRYSFTRGVYLQQKNNQKEEEKNIINNSANS